MLKRFLQGRFMRHPLHPMVVHLPVGLWTASLICDVVYFASGNPNWALASYYTMMLGIIGALIAVAPGLAEYVDIPDNTRVKKIATTHMVLNFIVAGLYAADLWLRYRIRDGAPDTVTTGVFILSLFAFSVLSFSGYLGGLMVYEYGIGFRPEERDRLEDREAA